MRKTLLGCLIAAFAIAAACSKAGGGGGNATPTPTGHGALGYGPYGFSNVSITSDSCGLIIPPSVWSGLTMHAQVFGQGPSDESLAMFGDPFPVTVMSGTVATGYVSLAGTKQKDFSTGNPARDCVLSIDEGFTGVTTTANQADLTYSLGLATVSGTECGLVASDLSAQTGAAVAFPCSSSADTHIARGPLQYSGSVTMLGTNGSLGLNGMGGGAAGIGLTAMGDAGGNLFSVASPFWSCLAPFSASPSAYLLESGLTGDPIQVYIYVPSAEWTPGTHPIGPGDVSVSIYFSTTAVGFAEGGTIDLITAPTVQYDLCNFRIDTTSMPVQIQPFGPTPTPSSTPSPSPTAT